MNKSLGQFKSPNNSSGNCIQHGVLPRLEDKTLRNLYCILRLLFPDAYSRVTPSVKRPFRLAHRTLCDEETFVICCSLYDENAQNAEMRRKETK
jgi:hypothetical protein